MLLPLLLEAGFNYLCPLEQAAGMDLLKIRREYGEGFALMGGLDKREIAKGRPEIDRELARQVPQLLEQGGFTPTLDHSVPPDISYDNFQYYLDRKRLLLGCG